MKVERVAIFGLDFPNIVNQLIGLRNGFRELGVEVLTAWPHPNALVLENVLDAFRPDIVFEINRSRNQIEECDAKFRHVCWMQDVQSLGERLDVNFGGSDLTYFLLPPSATGYEDVSDDTVGYLLPATNPEIFSYRAEPPIFDFSFVGQIFSPMSDELRSRRVVVDGVDCGGFADLEAHLQQAGVSHVGKRPVEGAAELLAFVRRHVPDAATAMIDSAVRNFCDEYFPRLRDRTRMLDTVMTVSTKVGLFGTGPWQEWPAYAPHFGGYLNVPSKLALVYRRTRVNLHNGATGLHPRVMDCMASGGVILVNKSPFDGTRFGMDAHFESGRHFVEYEFASLAETARALLEDDERRKSIGAAAAEAVHADHTWRRRARQILEDCARL
jgi:glycosyltransferase involved in cell wall biosynthesis